MGISTRQYQDIMNEYDAVRPAIIWRNRNAKSVFML